MRIDISSPDGNTIQALAHAIRFLRREGRHREASELQAAVFGCEDGPEVARELITEATFGAITFFDSRESV